ncbi:MAG: hypothetical protein ACI9PN_000757 [Candidatus Azotimanducaceae bacterium]|jgi:hypothetical protein
MRNLLTKLLTKLVTMPHAADESFVQLVRVAEDDPSVREILMTLLQLNNFQRKSALGSLVETMKLQGAPVDFIGALVCLRDDKVAQKLHEYLAR